MYYIAKPYHALLGALLADSGHVYYMCLWSMTILVILSSLGPHVVYHLSRVHQGRSHIRTSLPFLVHPPPGLHYRTEISHNHSRHDRGRKL